MSLSSLLRERLLDPVRRAQGTPESIARGGALGMWVALTPTVGVQLVLVAVLAVPLRANLPVGLALVWLTNPLTVVPFYYAFYWLGTVLLGRHPHGFVGMAARFAQTPDLAARHGLVDTLLSMGAEVLWPMIVGSFVLATSAAVPTYHLFLWLGRRRRQRLLLRRLEQRKLAAVQPIGEDAPSESSP